MGARPLIAATSAVALLLVGRGAAARSNGIVTAGCSGCHGSGATAAVTLAASPSTVNPGDVVTVTLTIRGASIKVGGAYVTTGGVGTLRPISGEGLAANTIDGLTHTAPKAATATATGDQVTFRFSWQAPSTPGAVDMRAFVIAGNGNRAPTGDAPGDGSFQAAYGCQGREYVWDGDGDGYGNRRYGVTIGCVGAPPPGTAAMDGDCDENDQDVHPGASEICNARDDDCDGEIDENAPAAMLWPDADGDGYYASQTGTPKMGCVGLAGYAAAPGDCGPLDPAVHPGATEICNGKDDNCDGRIDERVRPQCGIGWCVRESATCDPAACVPGPPHPETCNLADDDCDGEIDNGVVCGAGLRCVKGTCVADQGSGSGGAAGVSGGGAGGSAGGGSATGGAAGERTPTSVDSAGCGMSSCRISGGSAPEATGMLFVVLALAGPRSRRRVPQSKCYRRQRR